MRKAMVTDVGQMIENEQDTLLFLVDIGVWAFRNTLKNHPDRALNVGIFEDGMVSVAAGAALKGMIPTIYGISPFIVERAAEQLKLDFAYQKLQGNFITTGASYDFPRTGYSHYCPEDIGVISLFPGFQFIAPGTASQFSTLFSQVHRNGSPTYIRLSDFPNKTEVNVDFGRAAVIKEGKIATVVAVSTTLDAVLEACSDQDVTILYYTTLIPFDYETLAHHYNTGKILLCEPHFEGSLLYPIITAFEGLKREVFRNYGSKIQNDEYNELTVEGIRSRLLALLGD